MRPQRELTFVTGVPDQSVHEDEWEAYCNALIAAACHLSGGCMVVDAQGWWISDGWEHKEVFDGDVSLELVFVVKVTCETDKKQAVLDGMKDTIAVNAQMFNIPADWIHITEKGMLGHHFSVAEYAEKHEQQIKAAKRIEHQPGNKLSLVVDNTGDE